MNKNNSDHSILFEAMRLGMSMGEAALKDNTKDSIQLLAKFIGLKEPNIRYTALDLLSKATPFHLSTCPSLLKDHL